MRRHLVPLAILLFASTDIHATQTDTAPPSNELQNWCERVTRVVPGVKVKSCMTAQLAPVPVRSVNGRAIMLSDFKATGDAKARVLVVGGIHGDELTAVSVVFRWMELLQMPSNDAEQYHWRVVPLMNPDGLFAKPPKRVNARGVDLNRNFPTDDWFADAHRYWRVSARADPRRFPGTAPVSEPESRWLHNEIRRFRPDVIVSVHAPHHVLDFDGPPDVEPPQRFGPLYLRPLGVYPGSLGNFGGLKEGIPVVTLELPHALKMPSEVELAHVWRDMQQWLRSDLVERKKTSIAEPPTR
jgi:hypothetical protein